MAHCRNDTHSEFKMTVNKGQTIILITLGWVFYYFNTWAMLCFIKGAFGSSGSDK